jgi:hypothetical protein
MRPFGWFPVFITIQNTWAVAYWNAGGFWTLSGSSIQYADSDFGAIGTQIVTPTPQIYPQTFTGLDFNAVANALLAVLSTATWTDPNSGAPMQFKVTTRQQREATNQQASAYPWLKLIKPIHETTVPLPALSVEDMKFEAWAHLFQDPSLGSNNLPDASLTACENALRSAVYASYPINGVPGGYQQLPPGTMQTFGGLVAEVRVEGTTMHHLPEQGTQPMILILPVLVKAGNNF